MDALPATVTEGGGVQIVNFSSGPKPYEEVLTFLRKGTDLLKFGRMGRPKFHPFRLSNDDLELQWESKKGEIRRIPLVCIKKWQKGQTSSVFKRWDKEYKGLIHLSFSIYYQDQAKKERTLDVVCRNPYDFEMWFWGVQIVKFYPPSMFSTPAPLPPPATQQYSTTVEPVGKREVPPQPVARIPPPLEIPSVRASLTDDRTPKPVPKSKPGLSVMVGSRGSGLMQSVPPMRRGVRELGDLYVWGALTTYEQDEWYEPKASMNLARAAQRDELNPDSMRMWQNSREPVLVQNASSVDVVRVACAPRHAALITRKGELYTWGYGKDGNLGHGWCANLISPRLVTRMSGKGVHTVSCSEGATAAITADMRLYMWGNGSAGQLGNGYAFPCVEPAPVIFPGLPEDVRVQAVSCGPFHTAAITEGGYLYTWGNGLFGKLGHGTHASEFRPRRVAALEDKSVTCVSCGYWHTAAVAVPRTAAAVKEPSMPFILQTPVSTPVTTDGPPAAGAGDTSGHDHGAGRAGALPPANDASSSGSDLQSVVAAANGARESFTAPEGSAPASGGGGAGGASQHGGGALGHGRSELLSSSTASMEHLREASERSSAASDSAGMLFTWGGDFSWLENSDPTKQKRDHHGGCLGVGDKEGRLLPTRVRGDLDKHGVVQVACGWSMTIALSRDGRVYQMGSTGATKSGEKGCAWEGALTPTRVDGNLFNMYVEEVTCGMHHVVVVASKVQANGQIAGDQRRVRLLTWGRGSEGQLGVDSKADGASGEGPLTSRMPPQVDYLLPQVVSAVDGKRVLHVSAGGNHTMAVVEHDPRVRRMHTSIAPAATPTNPYGSVALATPSGAPTGTTGSRTTSHMQAPSIVGSVPARDSSTAAGPAPSSLLGMTSPFTIANALPSAASVQQTLSQMVGNVVPRSKLSTPASSTGTRASSRRQGPSRQMVAIPAPQRSELLRSTELRRSAANGIRAAAGGGGVAAAVTGHFYKSVSMHGKLQTDASVSSSGMMSHRSSPPMAKGQDEAESRSLSPSSSMLYEVGSSLGDLQSAREPGAGGAGAATSAAEDAHARDADTVNGAGQPRVHEHVYGPGGPATQLPSGEGSAMAALGGLSMTGLSTMEMDAEPDAYFRGRSLDMVPEQSEESPGSPRAGRHGHPHHAAPGFTQYHNANGVATTTTRGHEPYVDSPESVQEVLSLSAEGLPGEQHVAMHPRVALLARGSGGGSPGPGGVESMRFSVSTAETSYGTGSSGLSPQGLETPDDAVTSHSPRAGLPGGPYSMLHDGNPAQPPAMPYTAHLPPPPPAPVGVAFMPALTSSTPLASPGTGATGRGREISISAWAQQPAVPTGASAAAGQQAGGMFRGEASFRTFSVPADSGAGPMPEPTPQRHTNPVPVAAAGGRGSRGHSRHASHDSIDLAQGRDNRGVFELAPPSSFMPGPAGGSGGHTPLRLSANAMLQPVLAPTPAAAAADAHTLALKQQNDLLMQQVETLRQQVTLLAQAAGLGAAAAAAGGAAAAAGASTGTHAFAPTPHMAQSQPSTPAAAGAVHSAVPLPHGALQPQQGTVAMPVLLPGGELGTAGSAAAAAAAAASLAGTASSTPTAGMPSGVQLLPPPPLHLHHAMSMGHAAAAPLASPSGHGMAMLGPMSAGGAGGPVRASTFERQMHAGPGVAPHGDPTAAAAGARHRRSTSIDVSSLIATRDGIGPAKDYLAPAPPPPQPQPTTSMGHLGPGGGAGAHGRDGSAMGHHTAPPALDALRMAHPGMSLAQAALAEADEEGLDEDEDDVDEGEEEEEEEDDNGSVVEGEESAGAGAGTEEELSAAPMHVQPLSAPPQAVHGSLRRLGPEHPPQLSQQHSQGRIPGGYLPHLYELHQPALPEPAPAPQPGSRTNSFAAQRRSDASQHSSCSSSASVAGDAAAGDAAGDVGAHRGRRNVMVDMQQMLQQQHHHHASAGGAGRIGSSGGAPPGGGGLEDAYGHSPASSEGTVHQYMPGVYLTVKPPQRPGLRMEVTKVRFSRKHFSHVEAQQWLMKHRTELYERFNVTTPLGGGGSSRSVAQSVYSASPAAAVPQPSLQQPAVATHTRGPSIDTQGSSGAANSYYFSLPMSAMHGHGAAGSGGSAVGHPLAVAAEGSFTRVTPAAWGPAPATTAVPGGGGDPYAQWADVDPSVLAMPPLPPGAQPLAGMPPPAPRHHHSRSSSRNASGGASTSGAPAQSQMWAVPREAGTGPGAYPPGVGSGSESHFRHHSRSRSGGAASSQSNESSRQNRM